MISISDKKPVTSGNIKLEFYFEGTPVGELELCTRNGQIGVWDVRIYPDYRDVGLGNQMMIELVETIRKYFWDFPRAYLYVFKDNIKAIKAYEKAGFIINSTDDYSRYFRDPPILMEMEI